MLVLKIYEQLTDEGAVITESGQVWDVDGEILREIDILIERKGDDSLKRHTCMIECRDRSRKESIQWIDELIGKSGSLSVDKIIAVSNKGFAESAIKKAKAKNIDTITLEKCLKVDIPSYVSGHKLFLYSDFKYHGEGFLLYDINSNVIEYSIEEAKSWSLRIKGSEEHVNFCDFFENKFNELIGDPSGRKKLDDAIQIDSDYYRNKIIETGQSVMSKSTLNAMMPHCFVYDSRGIKLSFYISYVQFFIGIYLKYIQVKPVVYSFADNFVSVADINFIEGVNARAIIAHDEKFEVPKLSVVGIQKKNKT